MNSKRILIFAIFALAIMLAVLFSGCISKEEPSSEISMTDIDRMTSDITENVNLNDPTVSISTKLLADDPSKEIELESVDVTTIQYVYNFSITADRTMDDTLVVVGKDARGEIVYNKTEPIHLESGETQFFMVYIPVHKRDGQIIEDLTLTFKTLDEETIEIKTKIKTEKKPYAVSDKLKKTFASFDSDKDGTLSESERQTWWDWVEENVKYVSDVPDEFGDYTKTPDETVNEGGGDCEDMAVLNAEFYKSHGYEVQILYVATDKVGAYKGKRDHALTRVKIADEWMVVDNAAGGRLGDTIVTPAIPHPVDFSLEQWLKIHPIKGEKIDQNAIDAKGYDFNYDGKADLAIFDLNKDGVVDTYEFYKDGKKIQERHFEDGELIKTNYYDEEGNLILGETPESEVSPKVTVKPTHTPIVTPTETGPVVSEKDEYESEARRIYGEMNKLHEECLFGSSTWKRVDEAALQKEEKIIPPKGTEILHDTWIKYLKTHIEYLDLSNKENVELDKALEAIYSRDYELSGEYYKKADYYKDLALEKRHEASSYHDFLWDECQKFIFTS